MAITNFQFPGVELKQEFVETPVTGVSQLGVVIVGKQYKLMAPSLSDVELTFSKAVSSSTTIALTDIPSYNAADYDATDGYLTIDTSYSPVVAIEDGVFENYVTGTTVTGSTVKINTVAGGTASATAISEDGSSAVVEFDASLVSGTIANTIFGMRVPQVGDTVKLGTAVGSAVAGELAAIDASGKIATIVAVDGGTIANTSKAFFYAKEDAVLDSSTVAITSSAVTITSGAAKLGGSKAPLKALQAGTYTMSVGYRAINSQYTNTVGTIGSRDEIVDIFGSISVDNPMALALQFALNAGVENVVSFIAVKTEDLDGYMDAIGILDKDETVYSVVPLIQNIGGDTTADNLANQSIIQNILSAVVSTSENSESKVRRSLWYGIETPARGTNETNTSLADKIIAGRVTRSYRAQAVWADNAYYNGEPVPNYILAAAPAGMRSYEPTYRPISNLGYSFFSLKNSNGFTKSQLEKLGKNGIWIIDNDYEGAPSNKKQVTTAVANNLNLDEESIVSNADSIALTLCHVGENRVGNSNISPVLLKVLSDTITNIMENYLVNTTGNAYVGPQLLSWSLDSIYQDPVALDHIYAVITCEPPKPFNRFVMTLRIV